MRTLKKLAERIEQLIRKAEEAKEPETYLSFSREYKSFSEELKEFKQELLEIFSEQERIGEYATKLILRDPTCIFKGKGGLVDVQTLEDAKDVQQIDTWCLHHNHESLKAMIRVIEQRKRFFDPPSGPDRSAYERASDASSQRSTGYTGSIEG